MPKQFFVDTPELGAATVLALTSGRYDWLSGRYVREGLSRTLHADVWQVCRREPGP